MIAPAAWTGRIVRRLGNRAQKSLALCVIPGVAQSLTQPATLNCFTCKTHTVAILGSEVEGS